jgi:NAD(P)-dependent dehydrogenase (short-subunit alcohol dehydrogenase family)
VKEAVAAILAKNGRIHGLFNNAGGQFPSPAASLIAKKGFETLSCANNLTGGFLVMPRGVHPVDAEPRRRDRQHDGGHVATACPTWCTPAPRAPAWRTSP